MRNPSPMPRCSKAPRGLFVQVCVTRVFTGISVSPGPSSRQRPSRYTFRAGRNLPDKEFRSRLTSWRTSSPGGHDPWLRIRVPARRRADGTISSSKTPDVRRMASEDSAALSRAGLSCWSSGSSLWHRWTPLGLSLSPRRWRAPEDPPDIPANSRIG